MCFFAPRGRLPQAHATDDFGDGAPTSPRFAAAARVPWRLIARALGTNPVLLGICAGFALSFVLPDKDPISSARLPVFLDTALKWIGGCTSPVGVIVIGMFAANQGLDARAAAQQRRQGREAQASAKPPADEERGAAAAHAVAQLQVAESTAGGSAGLPGTAAWNRADSWRLALFLFAKLVLCPALMLLLALLLGLRGDVARVAVIIATLPVSLASFSLAQRYQAANAAAAAQVIVGTLLVLPTVLAWLWLLDTTAIF